MASANEKGKKGLLSGVAGALKDVVYGITVHQQVTSVVKTKMYIEHMFMLMILGDMLGFPILPPYYSLKLLPYAIPNIKGWKQRFYRDRDFTDAIYG